MNPGKTAREEMLSCMREAVVVKRSYLHRGTAEYEEIVERFIERFTDYKVKIRRVEARELSQAIADACAERGVHRLVVPADLPLDWSPARVELLRDEPPLSNERLDASDGVLTGCALGIAQTGTIVLDGGPSQGRRALTLLPGYHLCVINEVQIVDLVPEAITRLSEAVKHYRRPLTFISGPSATSDIELNRVEGVHGPRTLEVLLIHQKGAE